MSVITGVVQYGSAHHKNQSAIERMCRSRGIPYSNVGSVDELIRSPYNVAWVPQSYVPAELLKDKFVFYGPHFYVWASGTLVAPFDPAFDHCRYHCMSEWTKDFLEWQGHKRCKHICFPFGVDTARFAPNPSVEKKDILIYIKYISAHLDSSFEKQIGEITRYLEANRQTYYPNGTLRIFRYGSYHESDFLSALQTSKCGFWFGSTESQGFALQETLSSDVPLFVFNCTFYRTRPDMNNWATSAPYWDDRCGIKIDDPNTWSAHIETFLSKLSEYRPREYVIETLSDEVCMKRWEEEVAQYLSSRQ